MNIKMTNRAIIADSNSESDLVLETVVDCASSTVGVIVGFKILAEVGVIVDTVVGDIVGCIVEYLSIVSGKASESQSEV